MAKIPFQDVVPPEKRSIRDIPISPSRKNRPPLLRVPENRKPELENIIIKKAPNPTENQEGIYPTTNDIPKNDYFFYDKKPPSVIKNRSRIIFGGIVFVLVIGFIGLMMTIFSSANVTVTPKTQAININLDIKATTEIATTSVRYEVIKLSKTSSLVVDANGVEMVERRATGKITIYNNFSTEPQRLITRTRFESESGLIYRIPESVIVPGQTKTADGKIIPGSIEVTVVADEAGEKYNVDESNFTIPGFKNDAKRYAAFSAKTSGISGGIIGKIKVIDPTQKQTALAKIESNISEDIKKEIATQIPSELISIDGSMIFNFKELPQQDSDNTATLSKEGTVYVIALYREDLSKKIISEKISKLPDWQNIEAKIDDLSGLSIVNKMSPDDLNSAKILNLKLDGNVVVEAKIDTQKIAAKLTSIERDSISSAVSDETGILGIKATLRPIWKRSFPSNTAKIYVEVMSPDPK